ncbi:hypothetical protein HanXRQr2_Chr11g0497551 [Helianthus annuus]|uniref:Uncharacterized protein n=1 Tax=Helianthus annuus TaxID=4232 RepID=A0A9K3N0J0_HELAN|nr:hypothetical protein HanXRQr2_Chr11g0497541 [Helianthus annuus]KAF5782572.1 hypothetical protein HanXRQr2_Chr11g0497551 [Helianthus annuus]KAJ0882906.1 hypothetical protein HanPSC8_Chr10g0415091 [Helianthus annuus]KAJ0951785.1 hypothetical protein HanPSC8_Chr02g0064471 [Helianthus annuus]
MNGGGAAPPLTAAAVAAGRWFESRSKELSEVSAQLVQLRVSFGRTSTGQQEAHIDRFQVTSSCGFRILLLVRVLFGTSHGSVLGSVRASGSRFGQNSQQKSTRLTRSTQRVDSVNIPTRRLGKN